MKKKDDGPPDLLSVLDRRKRSAFDATFIRRVLLLVLGTIAIVYSFSTLRMPSVSPPAPPSDRVVDLVPASALFPEAKTTTVAAPGN